MIRKILLVAAGAALMSTPAWALPGQAPSKGRNSHAPSTTPVGPPSTTPNNSNNPGASNRSSHGDHGNNDSGNHGHANKPSHPGQSHKCKPHGVAYVAGGTLASQTLTKNADGTYSGEVTVEVTHTNRHASGAKGKTVTYKVTNAHVTFGMADTNNDGSVGLDDVVKGDSAKVIGKITVLAKKCSKTEFTAATTIRQIVFNAPPAS
jgi:hypothetical protein